MLRIASFSAALLISLHLAGQISPSFEVVSIRIVPPNTPPTLRTQDFTPILLGGQYIDSRTNLLFMIGLAYNVTNPSKQLVGLPKWADTASYAVAAKPADPFPALPPAENEKQVRLMMRSMLADRFQLRLHTETRKERVYSLKLDKGGIKIPEVAAPKPSAKEGYVNMVLGDSGGRMLAEKATMRGLARALQLFLRHPVVDQTGLQGYYDIDLRWEAPQSTGGSPTSSGLGAEGIALLISTVKDRLGLQLSAAPGPVEYWVVDHVAPPTEN